MKNQRHGRTIRLPSTVAIKHALLLMMLEDELRAIPPGQLFKRAESSALTSLQRLSTAPAVLQPAN